MNRDKKRVLILGAGSAGIGAALELKKASSSLQDMEITLVDQNNYHFVLPLIYQVLTGSVAPNHISFPLRALLRKRGNNQRFVFKQSRVQGIDLERNLVITDHGELQWDYLVVALGSTSNFFGMDEVEDNALCFRTLGDAVGIHNRIIDNFESALLEKDEKRRREMLNFIVIGGGPTGVELAVSIQEFVSKVLIRDYPSLKPYARVVLVEAQDRILLGMKAKMGEITTARLHSQGIDILLGTRIVKALPDSVETSDGQIIPTRTVIWVAGVKPVNVVESLPLEKARDGRIIVNEYLEVPQSPGLYVLGDCGYLLQGDGSVPYPATHQVASRQGPFCARNIIRSMRGESQRPFRYQFKGQIIYLGRDVAVAQILNRVLNGSTAVILRRISYTWQVISYLGLLTGFRNKVSTIIDWSFSYLYSRFTASIE